MYVMMLRTQNWSRETKIRTTVPIKATYILVEKEYNMDAVPDDVFAASVPG
jgi:hypothetical protein